MKTKKFSPNKGPINFILRFKCLLLNILVCKLMLQNNKFCNIFGFLKLLKLIWIFEGHSYYIFTIILGPNITEPRKNVVIRIVHIKELNW